MPELEQVPVFPPTPAQSRSGGQGVADTAQNRPPVVKFCWCLPCVPQINIFPKVKPACP
jgi:hypothetical protein